VEALAEFLSARGLDDNVHPFYGVDQGNKRQFADLVDGQFGSESIDLVIDDASHLWDRTRASFEVLYPRLRPGGLFVIEDWATQYFIGEEMIASLADPTSAQYADFQSRYDNAVSRGTPGRPPLARFGV
jgi:predicted O-methyltransferase YrrM